MGLVIVVAFGIACVWFAWAPIVREGLTLWRKRKAEKAYRAWRKRFESMAHKGPEVVLFIHSTRDLEREQVRIAIDNLELEMNDTEGEDWKYGNG